jgi:glycerophosphoryl diester phosphodiesterase
VLHPPIFNSSFVRAVFTGLLKLITSLSFLGTIVKGEFNMRTFGTLAGLRRPGVMLAVACIVLTMTGSMAAKEDHDGKSVKLPIVIGHRGASGFRPEHTVEAYWLAIQEGADYIEPDLVPTLDGVLVARHENDISGTTNVADHPEFSGRRKTKVIDGVSVTGWFTEDFTLAELRTLRAKERLPLVRGTQYDGLFLIPTLQDVIDLVEKYKRDTGRVIGIYPETKHPSYFKSIGLALEGPLVRVLDANGYSDKDDPAFIQSFEVANLKELNGMTRLPLVQLLNEGGKPFDFVLANDPRTYADLATPAGLAEIRTYADGVGVNKNLIFPRRADGSLLPATSLIRDAHAKGLIVHGWTFRAENSFLPLDFRIGANPILLGDLAAEVELFLKAGMDGFFTDHPGIGNAARDTFVEKTPKKKD